MRRAYLPFLLCSVLAACAHDEPVPQPNELPAEATALPAEGRFVLTGIRRPVVALVTPQGIQGPNVNLGRYDNGTTWRGTVYGRDVNISIPADGAQAEGLLGRQPFNLGVTPGPDGVAGQGLIGGTPSTFTFSKARINGNFGRCGYDLRFAGQAYLGQRSCNGPIDQVGVTLPPVLNTWRDVEVATVLALLLNTPF
jgi:hypothetical protein